MLADVYAVFVDTRGREFVSNKLAPKACEAQGYAPFLKSSAVRTREVLKLRAPDLRSLPGLGVTAEARRTRQAVL